MFFIVILFAETWAELVKGKIHNGFLFCSHQDSFVVYCMQFFLNVKKNATTQPII